MNDTINSLKTAQDGKVLTPIISSSSPHTLSALTSVGLEEVEHLIRALPDCTLKLNIISTLLLKMAPTLWAPLISQLANISFATGIFPTDLQQVHIIPILKKENLPSEDPASCRPIATIPTLSKVLETLSKVLCAWQGSCPM